MTETAEKDQKEEVQKNEEEGIKEIPQDSELIENIIKECKENKNNINYIPSNAIISSFSLNKDDESLKMTMKDGACQFYSFLYVIFRDPQLKSIFEKRVLKTDDSYYIKTKIKGENYTFRIPMSTIQEEKAANRGNLYPCDSEYVTALGVFLHAVFYFKCGFIDRLSFQPFFNSDAFFDQPIRNVGYNFNLILNTNCENSNFLAYLKNDQNQINLENDGSLLIQNTNEHLVGHYIAAISIFPIQNKFGHILFVFFNREENAWKVFNTCPDDYYEKYGETHLKDLKHFNFNGSCIIVGISNEVLHSIS